MYEAWFGSGKTMDYNKCVFASVPCSIQSTIINTSWLVPGMRYAESEFDTQFIELECALIASVNVMAWCI